MSKQLSSNIHNSRLWIACGSLFALLSVVFGAFAAHALKSSLSEYQLGIIDTGLTYQMFHAIAILFVGLLAQSNASNSTMYKSCNWINWGFTVGIICFSGSLYLLAITSIKVVAFITPIGGLLFLLAWTKLIYTMLNKEPK